MNLGKIVIIILRNQILKNTYYIIVSMKCPKQKNPQRQTVGVALPGGGGGETENDCSWALQGKGSVSFGVDENTLELEHGAVSHLSEYNNH